MNLPAAGRFRVELAEPLPRRLAVGRGQVLGLMGWCRPAGSPVVALRLLLDGRPLPAPVRLLGPVNHVTSQVVARPEPSACAFTALAPLPVVTGERVVTLGLRARLRRGGACAGELGRIRLCPAEAPAGPLPEFGPGDPTDGPLVAVCMATYNPPAELFARQIETIRRQTHRHWVCVLSDDGSSPAHLARMRRELGADPRFVLRPAPRRLGFYHNFEHALALVPARAEFVALADQDDVWHPDKLATLLAAFDPDTALVYADLRVVDRAGRCVSETFWTRHRNNWTDLGAMLLANSVTGAAAMFRRQLLDDLLPFPPKIGEPFHDHWLACVALARGRLRYVPRPLHDYVQHGGNVAGHVDAAPAIAPPARDRWAVRLARRLTARPGGPAALAGALRRRLRAAADNGRTIYYRETLRIRLMARVLQARCGDGLPRAHRVALARFAGSGESWAALAVLTARGLTRRGPIGEAVGAEITFVRGCLWERAARVAAALRAAVRSLTPRRPAGPDRSAADRAGGAAA